MTTSEESGSAFMVLGLSAGLSLLAACSSPRFTDRKGFASPEGAVDEIILALQGDDMEELVLLLGPRAEDLLDSGDPVADRAGRGTFLARYAEAHVIEQGGEGTVHLLIGEELWPFPIPLVRAEGSWYFDTEEGAEELLDRRIGRNELAVIQVLLALVDAQGEYVAEDWEGDGLFEYAQRIRSSPGTRDGLYWPTEAGVEPSPLGELVAVAEQAGYDTQGAAPPDGGPRPYHGYYFRLMTSQGAHAQGGAYDYMATDHMIGGFALVAHPARYGDSGIMTFIVNHEGLVYEKDLGQDSETEAKSLAAFDPDSSWKAVQEH